MAQEAVSVEQSRKYTLSLNDAEKIMGNATIKGGGKEIRLNSPKPNPHPLAQLRELARSINFGKHGKSIQICVVGSDNEWQIIIKPKNGTTVINYINQKFNDRIVIN